MFKDGVTARSSAINAVIRAGAPARSMCQACQRAVWETGGREGPKTMGAAQGPSGGGAARPLPPTSTLNSRDTSRKRKGCVRACIVYAHVCAHICMCACTHVHMHVYTCVSVRLTAVPQWFPGKRSHLHAASGVSVTCPTVACGQGPAERPQGHGSSGTDSSRLSGPPAPRPHCF